MLIYKLWCITIRQREILLSNLMKIKTLVPHIFTLGIIFFLLYVFIWNNMMFTNNQGEFGYPDQGIYVWSAILPILIFWFIPLFIMFELPLILYQWTKRKVDVINK